MGDFIFGGFVQFDVLGSRLGIAFARCFQLSATGTRRWLAGLRRFQGQFADGRSQSRRGEVDEGANLGRDKTAVWIDELHRRRVRREVRKDFDKRPAPDLVSYHV